MSWPEDKFWSYFGSGIPVPSMIAFPYQAPQQITFNADLAGIAGAYPQSRAAVAATATTVFTVEIALAASPNVWAVVGSVTFAPGAVTGTIASVGHAAPILAVGDTIAVRAPASPDATLAGVAITLVGARG